MCPDLRALIFRLSAWPVYRSVSVLLLSVSCKLWPYADPLPSVKYLPSPVIKPRLFTVRFRSACMTVLLADASAILEAFSSFFHLFRSLDVLRHERVFCIFCSHVPSVLSPLTTLGVYLVVSRLVRLPAVKVCFGIALSSML